MNLNYKDMNFELERFLLGRDMGHNFKLFIFIFRLNSADVYYASVWCQALPIVKIYNKIYP